MFIARISRRPVIILTIVAAFAVAGCGGAGDRLINPVGSSGDIQIQITRNDVPEFRWTGGIIVQQIRVMSFGTEGTVSQVLWGYTNTPISPPVTYGQVIAGGTSLTGSGTAGPLQSGRRYRVQVTKDGVQSYADWVMP